MSRYWVGPTKCLSPRPRPQLQWQTGDPLIFRLCRAARLACQYGATEPAAMPPMRCARVKRQQRRRLPRSTACSQGYASSLNATTSFCALGQIAFLEFCTKLQRCFNLCPLYHDHPCQVQTQKGAFHTFFSRLQNQGFDTEGQPFRSKYETPFCHPLP